MRRMFWVGVGAVAGFYAARRGEKVVDDARERGLGATVGLATTKVATATMATAKAVVGVGAAAGSRARSRTTGPPDVADTSPEAAAARPPREVRP